MSGNLGDPIGQNIAHYVIERRIGGGAMASVYQATDQIFDRTIALKVLMPGADALTRQRFRQEARTVSILDHPNIVKTLQVGQTSADGVAYIAMDMVHGKSLSTLLDEESTLSVGASCALLEPIARALAYAHSLGVVHRDVKPSNILLHRVDETDERAVPIYTANRQYNAKESMQCDAFAPYLSDFGIARALDSPELTSAGRTIGTPAYMAPEQCAGSREIDGRADIYSLGTVLYRCLVGRPPFIGTTTQILHAHVYEPLMIPDDILSELPTSVIEALRRSLMKEPEYRYKDASEMADALATVSSSYTGEFQAAIASGVENEKAARELAPTRTVALMDSVADSVVEDSGSTSHVLIPGPLPDPVSVADIAQNKVGTATQTQININRVGSTTHQRVVRPPISSAPKRTNWIGIALGATVLLLLAFVGLALFRNLSSTSTLVDSTSGDAAAIDTATSEPLDVVGSVSTPVSDSVDGGSGFDSATPNSTSADNSDALAQGPTPTSTEVNEETTPSSTSSIASTSETDAVDTADEPETTAGPQSDEPAETAAADEDSVNESETPTAATSPDDIDADENGADSENNDEISDDETATPTDSPSTSEADSEDNSADGSSTPTLEPDDNDSSTSSEDELNDNSTDDADEIPETAPSPLELKSWLEDANYFFASREWFSALDYLKLLERNDRSYEVDKVQSMLAVTYVGLGNRQLLNASEQGALNTNQLESALSYYRKAIETDGPTSQLPQLITSIESYLRTDSAQMESAKSQLSDAFAAYSGTLLSQNENCAAMEQITASLRVKYDSERLELQKEISNKCPALAGLILPEISLTDLSGRLIYSSRDNAGISSIWEVEAQEDARSKLLLPNGRNPAISHNDAIMAFRSDSPEGIRGYDLAGTLGFQDGFIQFTYNPEDSLDSPPTWSPSNQRIIFGSTVSSDRVPRIYWANNSAVGDYVLVGDGREPDWHPTDDLIVFKGADFTGNQPGLWLMSSYGGDRRPLTQNGGDTRPVWSPDGTTVIFMSDRRDGNWEIYAVDVQTQAVQRLSNNPAQDGLPAVSPDGQMVAFLSNRENGSWHIYIVPIRGGNVERLTSIEGSLSNWLEHSIQWVE